MEYPLQLIYLHWSMVTSMRILIINLVLCSFLFGQKNSIDIATAGANKLRMQGQLNVFHNPATMGYNLNQLQVDTLSNNIPMDDFSEPIEEDQSNNDENEFSEFDNSQDDLSDSISLKVDEVITPSDSIISDTLDVKSHFSMNLFSISFGLGSGSITPDWITNQLFGGRDLRNIDQRKSFLKGISKDINVQLPIFYSLPLLNFSFGSNVVSLGQVVSYSSVNVPADLAQVPFIGLEKDEELNINSLDIEHITYLPISYSKGFILKPGVIPYGEKSYAGIRVNLLIGIAEIHTKSVKGTIKGLEENTLVDADIEVRTSLPVEIDETIPKGSFPIGLGFDLGLITELDEKFTVGFSIDNLFASFNWSGATTYSANVQGSLTPDEIADADTLSELLDQSELKESSSYKTSLPTSINFSGTYKAEDWVVLDGNIRLDLGKSYWASKKPLISIGSEFFPETKAPLYFGISFGGENSFVWGTGISLKMGSVIFDLSGGQLGGLFNNATGMQFGFGLRIQK